MSDPAQLAAEIKAHVAKGDAALGTAEQYYKEAGRQLKVLLKHLVHLVSPWVYIKANCGIGKRRAQDLMAIADGRTTVKELREKNKVANAELRLRQRASRDASIPATTVSLRDPKPKIAGNEVTDNTVEPTTTSTPGLQLTARELFLGNVRDGHRAATSAANLSHLVTADDKDLKAIDAVAKAWAALAANMRARTGESVAITADHSTAIEPRLKLVEGRRR